jgi:hypothetical protein
VGTRPSVRHPGITNATPAHSSAIATPNQADARTMVTPRPPSPSPSVPSNHPAIAPSHTMRARARTHADRRTML